MTGKASDEDAAWRDLVAQFDLPATAEGTPSPWPASEDLPVPDSGPANSREAVGDSADDAAIRPEDCPPGGSEAGGSRPGNTGVGGPGPGPPHPADRRTADRRTADRETADRETPDRETADRETPDRETADRETPDRGTADRETPDRGTADERAGGEGADGLTDAPAAAGTTAADPPPQIRIIRPALPPPMPDTDDERYVPPPPPPLPHLDATSKLAWTALFGGPAYLLVSVMGGWQISGLAGFVAIGAFVGGFATLIMRMGERPPDDSDPDDGAVV